MSRLVITDSLKDLLKNLRMEEFLADRGVQLISRGQNHECACPLPDHDESNPSFKIHKTKQFFHCFGCGVSGDIFDLVQILESTDFIGAIEYIANYLNYDLSKHRRDLTETEKRLEKFYKINKAATTFCMSQTPQYKAYFSKNRGVSNMDVLPELMIGFSINMESLVEHLSKQYSMGDLQTLEFSRRDMWDDAAVYPVVDRHGNVCKFYTKQMAGEFYIGNSKDMPTYTRDTLFGLHVAKKYVAQSGGKLILVEGQVDCIQMHSYGYKNTVALAGLSINSELLSLIAKENRIKEAVFMPDGDTAGRKSLMKVNPKLPIPFKVAILPKGDPDEFLRHEPSGSMDGILSHAKYVLEYKIENIIDKYKITGSSASELAMLQEIDEVVELADEAEVRLASKILSNALGVDQNAIIDKWLQRVGKVPSDELACENKVISAMLNDRMILGTLAFELSFDDFMSAQHQHIFRTLSSLDLENIPTVTPAIVTEVTGVPLNGSYAKPNIDSIDYWVSKVKDHSRRRAVAKLLTGFQYRLGDTNNNLQLTASSLITDIANKIQHSTEHIQKMDVINETNMHLLSKKMLVGGERSGLSLGGDFPILDSTIGGLRIGSLVVLSGATGVGKTNVTLDLVLSAMREEIVPVLWFSVEMGCNELWIRMVSKQSGIAPHKIETGSLTSAEYESVTNATNWLESLPIYIDDRSNINIADVVSTTRWHIAQHSVRVVVVDYAQLLGSSKADDNLYQKGGEISKNLKDLAKSGNLTAILLSQLTRGVMEGQIGGIRNVAESFKIPQDADSFISFNDKSQADIQNQGWNAGNRTIFVDKNRHGRSKISIPTMFDEVSLKSKEVSLI